MWLPDPDLHLVLSSAVIGFTKLVGFFIVVASAIITFYAAIHTININSQIDVFFAGLLALLVGIVAGPLYCLVSYYGLQHYLAFTPLGAVMLVIPVLVAWCFMAYTTITGYLRG